MASQTILESPSPAVSAPGNGPHNDVLAEVQTPAGKNESFVLQEQGKFLYEVRAKPILRSTRDVLVKVMVTGLCGSDIHYWQHGRIGRYVVDKPIVLGHESAGIIEECGSAVKSLKAGDRVALEPGAACNNCQKCRTGRYNLCPDVKFAATPPYDGTLATYYVLPEECCHLLPSQVSLREGALVEPLSVAVHCCRLAGDAQGKSFAIFGAGPIGLLCCAVARAFGAASIVSIDIAEDRLAFAKRSGATYTFRMPSHAPESNAQELCTAAKLGEGADVVIDATGVESCIECGLHSLKRGGTFVQAGLGSPRINLPIGQICDKEAVLKGSFRYGPGDYDLAVELLSSQRVGLKDMITHQFSFGEAEKAFMNVVGHNGIKTIIYGPGIDASLVG